MWEVSLEGRISAILKTGTFGFPMEMLGNIPKVMQWHVVDPEEPLETPDGRSQTEWRNTRNVSLVMADEKAQYEVFVGWLFDAMLEGDYLDLDERDEFRGVDTWARFWTLCGEVRDACTNEQMVRFLEGVSKLLIHKRRQFTNAFVELEKACL